MKKLATRFLAFSSIGLLMMMSSCKKNDKMVTDAGTTSSTLSASSTTLVLDRTRVNDTTAAVTFTFTAPHYTFKSAGTNEIQVDVPGDNWKNAATYQITGNNLKQAFSTVVFDNLVLKLNLPAGQASPVNVRVVNSLSSETAIYSNVVAITVTPFNLTSYIYVVGAFQGWNAGSPDSLVSITGNGIYTGIINFTQGNNQFLILPAKNYNNKYATSTTVVPTSSVTYNASNNLNAPTTAGQYIVTFNLNAGTITFQAADSYSVIGDAAQGWSTDLPMKFVNDGKNNWVLTLPLVSTGSFKIRQDDAWTNSWGIPNSGTAGYGVPNTLNSTTNSNIAVTKSGTYTVSFNAPPSVGGAGLTTTTYSVTQ